MKKLKITTLFILLLTPLVLSAKIEFRSPIKNSYQKNANISYLSIENNIKTTHHPIITNNNTSYYKQYKIATTPHQMVSYNNHITMTSFNAAEHKPFDDSDAIVNTAPKQYAFGPPDKGPIGDVIFPLLLFVGIYLIKLRIKS